MTNGCAFCDNTEIASRLVYDNEYFFVIPTNIPIVPGHLLICTKRHIQIFEDLTQDEQRQLFLVLTKTKQALRESFSAEGYNYAWNEGGAAGQTVPHFHLHLLPRKVGDAGVVNYEPREFLYRPGARTVSPVEELNAVADLVKRHMSSSRKKG